MRGKRGHRTAVNSRLKLRHKPCEYTEKVLGRTMYEPTMPPSSFNSIDLPGSPTGAEQQSNARSYPSSRISGYLPEKAERAIWILLSRRRSKRSCSRSGIADVPSKDYQVDYLINPQLGGTDDIRNLWPQPYGTTVWMLVRRMPWKIICIRWFARNRSTWHRLSVISRRIGSRRIRSTFIRQNCVGYCATMD
jgi:hypothetical protein